MIYCGNNKTGHPNSGNTSSLLQVSETTVLKHAEWKDKAKRIQAAAGDFFSKAIFLQWELSNISIRSREKLWSLHYVADIKLNGTQPWESLSKVLLLWAMRWASWPQDQLETVPQYKPPHHFGILLFLKDNFSSITRKTWKQLNISL